MAYLSICATGQRFSTAYLTYGWQLAPWEDLRARPLQSVWYLHIQPPLWNLVLGAVGRWSPLPTALSLQLLMAALGVVGVVLLADALRCCGVPPGWAAALAVVSMLIPDLLANAFGAGYELAVATMLIVLVWLAARAQQRAARGRWFVAMAVVATMLTMTRTVFHPVWLTLVVTWFAWRWRRQLGRRHLVVAALVPLVVVGGWMVKNELLVGRFTLSTWSGMNLQRAVLPELPADVRDEMVAGGRLSEVALAGPFKSFTDYEPAVGPCTERASDPDVLARPVRDGPLGIPNFNARCYLAVFDLAGHDALTVIRQHPAVYAEGRAWAARVWFSRSGTPPQSPSVVLRALSTGYQFGLVGVPGTIDTQGWSDPIFGSGPARTRFLLVLVACSIGCVVAAVRRGRHVGDVERLVGFLVAWTFATACCSSSASRPGSAR